MTTKTNVALTAEEIDDILVLMDHAMQTKEIMGARVSKKDEDLFNRLEDAKRDADRRSRLDD